MPRSPAETDDWIRRHEREHETLEARMRTIVREESKDALDGMKKHVAGLETKLADVELETRGQTSTINAIKAHTDTLVAQSLESAEERGRRKERDEERAKRQTEAEIKLKTWQGRAVPIGLIFTVVSIVVTYLVAKGH